MKTILPTAIMMGVGIISLMAFFIDNPILAVTRLALTDWVVILAGLALLIGLLNLLIVHTRKIQAGTRGWPYSMFVILSALIVLVVGLLEGPQATFEESSLSQVIFDGVLVAGQASLAGLIVFFLIFAAARMLNRKPGLSSIGFLVVVLIVLLGWLPIGMVQSSVLPGLRSWLLAVPSTAGARGILLGVALGTIVLGVRALTGAQWPYRE